ncbi:MAG TPA: EamA family transporter [Terracidiphilus sp.]
MTSSASANSAHGRPAATATIVLAFVSVYFFWGSTYTAIRIGAAQMPPLLLAGTRFSIAGALLLLWCRIRGLQLWWPGRTMPMIALVGLLLLGGGNLGLIYAEQTVPSGLASLIVAVVPLYVALFEMILPGGEPLPRRGWIGMALGFAGLAVLVWPSIRSGIGGNRERLIAESVLLAGALSWTGGSVLARRARLPVNSFVAAAWEMIVAGAFSVVLDTVFGQWPQFHFNGTAAGSLAWLITGGSLIGYSAYIYLLEHVPVAKVSSYAYVNPVVAVLLGIFFLHEQPEPAEFVGMLGILVAVFLLTTAQVKKKAVSPVLEDLRSMPVD